MKIGHALLLYIITFKNIMIWCIQISLLKEGVFESLYFEVGISLSKKRKSKTMCRDYETTEEYANCVDTALKAKLLGTLGCIPPWVFINRMDTIRDRGLDKFRVIPFIAL